MSIFGKMDAEKISDNPYKIEAGTYNGEVTDASIRRKADGTSFLNIEYTVQDEDSPYKNMKAYHRFDLPDPEMSESDLELLPPDEKKKILMRLASMKKTLCGQEGNERDRGLGETAESLNDPEWSPEVLKGRKIRFGIRNYGANDSQVQVSWVNLDE